MEKKNAVNWEEEYNIWFCESDSILEGLMVNSVSSSNGITITIDEGSYKISRPDSKFLELYYERLGRGNKEY